MGKESKILFIATFALLASFWICSGEAATKLKYGSHKRIVQQVLPFLVAEQKGFFTQEGLEVEWFPFGSGAAVNKAMAARALAFGMTGTADFGQAVVAGIPSIIVADSYPSKEWFVWVRADSRLKKAKDLKDAKVSVGRFGSTQHSYARMVSKVLGIEGQMKYLASGGVGATIAMLKSGAIDACVLTIFTMADLQHRGEIRPLMPLKDYFPQKWLTSVIAARRDFIKRDPMTTKAFVRSMVKAFNFVSRDEAWSISTLKKRWGYSPEAARIVYGYLSKNYSKTGRIDPVALANVVKFLVDYDVIPQEKIPSISELYTNKFID